MQLVPPKRREWLQRPINASDLYVPQHSPYKFQYFSMLFWTSCMFTVGNHWSSPSQSFSGLPTTVWRELGNFIFHRAAQRFVSTPGRPPRIRSTSSPSATEFVKKIFSDLDSIMSSSTTLLLDTCCLTTWHTRLWNNPRLKHVQISSVTESSSEKIKHVIYRGHNLMHRDFVPTLNLPTYPMAYPRRLVRSNY